MFRGARAPWHGDKTWVTPCGHYAGVTASTLTVSAADSTVLGDYRCVVSNQGGSTPSSAAALTINDSTPPTLTCPPNLVVSVDARHSSKSNVTWEVVAADNCAVISVVSEPPSGSTFPAGVTTVRCTAADASGNTNACSFTVTVLAPPVLLCGPADQTVPVGQNATFCVSATNDCGSPLSYQWRFKGGEIPGATTGCYTLASVRATNAGSYDVVVTNHAGALTSLVAVLTVVGPYVTVYPVAPSPTGGGKTNFLFVFPSASGIEYIVQYKDALTDTHWLPLTTNAGTGGPLTNDFPITTGLPGRFFRILVP